MAFWNQQAKSGVTGHDEMPMKSCQHDYMTL